MEAATPRALGCLRIAFAKGSAYGTLEVRVNEQTFVTLHADGMSARKDIPDVSIGKRPEADRALSRAA